MEKGNFDLIFNGTVCAIVWMDKSPIYFVSSIFCSSPAETVPRYDPIERRRVPIPCPKLVKAYNAFMGGTDKNDQITKLQKCRRHYRWPRRLMMKFFMWAAYNAYVLMNTVKPHYNVTGRAYTFHFFIEDLCNQLVGDYSAGVSIRRRSSVDVEEVVRLKRDADHFAERPAGTSTNYRCVVCSEKYNRAKRRNPNLKDKDLPKRRKTVFRCSFCKQYLCIWAPPNNCWEKWHSKQKYWQ
jgi:hypothetical protein